MKRPNPLSIPLAVKVAGVPLGAAPNIKVPKAVVLAPVAGRLATADTGIVNLPSPIGARQTNDPEFLLSLSLERPIISAYCEAGSPPLHVMLIGKLRSICVI